MLSRTTNPFSVAKMDFHTFDASHIKSMREDFNDMFQAEAEFRRKRGDLSVVFCLTYNDEHLHIAYGHNMLDSDDLKRFSKSSRFEKFLNRSLGYSFDYVCVGEFGEGGATHHYVGKRGKGNNPHYHCVGWFHKIGQRNQSSLVNWFLKKNLPLYLTTYTDEELLPLLVRFEWQGCVDDDPLSYALNPFSRSLGLGFVKLDGQIRFSNAGGSYISKYIGKDIKSLYRDCFGDGYVPQLLAILKDAVSENLVELPVSKDYFLALYLRWRGRYSLSEAFCASFDIEFLYDDVYFKQLGWFAGVLKNGSPAAFIVERLDELCKLFDDEFNDYMSNRYSPKVRKFHGFGYSLLDNADKVAGKYEIVKNGVSIHRQLPSSLCRYLYYDFKRVAADDVVHEKHFVVKYTLNSLGRKHLHATLVKSLQKDLMLAKSCGSDNLKENAVAAVCFNAIRSFRVVKKFDYDFYIRAFSRLVSNFRYAIGFSLMARQTFVFDEVYEDDRCFLDWSNLALLYFRPIFDAGEELRKLRYKTLSEKNSKDRDYINHNNIVYMFNY